MHGNIASFAKNDWIFFVRLAVETHPAILFDLLQICNRRDSRDDKLRVIVHCLRSGNVPFLFRSVFFRFLFLFLLGLDGFYARVFSRPPSIFLLHFLHFPIHLFPFFVITPLLHRQRQEIRIFFQFRLTRARNQLFRVFSRHLSKVFFAPRDERSLFGIGQRGSDGFHPRLHLVLQIVLLVFYFRFFVFGRYLLLLLRVAYGRR